VNSHYLQNLIKAARAGMTHYAPPEDWTRAIEAIAKANTLPAETFESAYVRLTASDPTCKAMDACRRGATQRTGRPRKSWPTAKSAKMTAAETELAERAMKRARAEGISFEKAFVREIDTPEGRTLYMQTKESI
jgi:hypothetical protein